MIEQTSETGGDFRKLASVQMINSLTPIANADAIELASILGWHVVVKKSDGFKEGDVVVFCEIDSILPDKPEFEFLRERKFRIKTIKLRGQVSQGIAFPMSVLPQPKDYQIGEDVSEILGVKKWELPIPASLAGKVKGAFPSFLSKTDETRVQVLVDVLARHEGIECYITEKLDGTSATFYVKNGEFGVCSRNLELLESEGNAYWQVARELKIEEKLRSLNRNVSIQGELFGKGIQKNSLGVGFKTIRFFNVFDIDKYAYLDFNEAKTLIEILGLEFVPVLEDHYLLESDVDTLVKKATRKSVLNKEKWAEGIVIRPLKEKIDLQMAQGFGNGRLSFKSVNPEYLLKNDG